MHYGFNNDTKSIFKEGDIVLVKARIINTDASVNHLPALAVVPESEEGTIIEVCHNSMVIIPSDIVEKIVYHYCVNCGFRVVPLTDEEQEQANKLRDKGFSIRCQRCGGNIFTTIKPKNAK